MDYQAELKALERIMSDACSEPTKLSYGFMRSITDNFSNEIGRGGFGVVYKGVLPNEDVVAVKKLLNLHTLPENKFLDEITCLKKAKHKNIVKFLGYCSQTQGELLQYHGKNIIADDMSKLLCFEYVPNGNIRDYLQREKSHRDDWQVRYQMIRGIVEGLHYLHDKKINHLDLKPENVMLGAHMDPKITDFGLSRSLDQGKSNLITQSILGTFGYIAPECIDKGEISFKSDMYALGIIIIELLTGINRICLDNWDELLDFGCPRVRRCAEIARKCVDPEKRNRPTILEVRTELDELQRSLELTSGTWSSINQLQCLIILNGAIGSTVMYIIHLQTAGLAHRLPGTDLLDVYPLQLRFRFVPKKKEMHCHVNLINKTDNAVLYAISQISSKTYSISAYIIPPKATAVISLSRPAAAAEEEEEEEELPLEMEKLEVVAITTGGSDDLDTFQERFKRIQTLFGDEYKLSATYYARACQKLFGYEFHAATSMTVVCENHRQPAPLYQMSWHDIIGHIGEAFMSIYTLDVHPTEPLVLINPDNNHLYIWNWQTEKGMVKHYDNRSYGPEETESSAIFIDQKQWVVVGSRGGFIHVFTCPRMEEVKSFSAHRSGVSSVAVHPNRSLLLSCSTTLIKLWDWSQDWSCTRVFESTAPVTQVMFNPRHISVFATRHDDGRIQTWRICRPDSITKTKEEVSKGIRSLFTYSGHQQVIAVTRDYTTLLFNPSHDEVIHSLHIDRATITAIVCHPTLPVLVTASENGRISLWDSATYRLKNVYSNLPMYPLHIGLTGSRLTRLVIGYRREITVIDIDLE